MSHSRIGVKRGDPIGRKTQSFGFHMRRQESARRSRLSNFDVCVVGHGIGSKGAAIAFRA
jgi:hypothetical protein